MTIKSLLPGLLLLMVLATPGLAQDTAAPAKAPTRKRWQPAAAAIILVLAAGAVSIMGSKRGHQD